MIANHTACDSNCMEDVTKRCGGMKAASVYKSKMRSDLKNFYHNVYEKVELHRSGVGRVLLEGGKRQNIL